MPFQMLCIVTRKERKKVLLFTKFVLLHILGLYDDSVEENCNGEKLEVLLLWKQF